MTARRHNAIRLLPIDADTHAELDLSDPGPGSFDTVVKAVAEGTDGDDVTVETQAGGLWVPNVGTLTAAANPTNAKATGILTAAGNATRANAVGTLTLNSNPSNADTVTLGARVYVFQTVLTNVDGNVLIGATASDSLDNLIAAITLGAGSGTLYAAATTLHSTATAAAGAGDTMVATAKASGTGGNSLATLDTLTDVVSAWGNVTLVNGATAETVTLGTTVYTFVNYLTTAFHVLIGATASDTLDNLIAAINAAAGSGTLYGTGTTAHPTVTAAAGAGDTIDVTAVARGTSGNSIASTETCASMSFGATALAGGTLETVTIDTTVYTLKHSSNLTTAYDVKIGASASDTLDNLIAAINANGTPGTEYYAGTLVHPTVRAYAGAGDTLVVQTKSDTTLNAVGTLIATTETAAQLSWGATTLADGTDGTNVEIEVTGTDVLITYSEGYSTVADVEAALAASAEATAVLTVETAGTTPLYQLAAGSGATFGPTNLVGGGASADNSAPTAGDESDGVDRAIYGDQATLLYRSVAGSGALSALLELYGWHPDTSDWYKLGDINDGDAIAGTDRMTYVEVMTGLGKFTKFKLVEDITGTGLETEAWLDFDTVSSHR